MKPLLMLAFVLPFFSNSFSQEFENYYSGYFNYYDVCVTDSLIFVGGDQHINIFHADGTYYQTKYVDGVVYSIAENSNDEIFFGVYSHQGNGKILKFDGIQWNSIGMEDGLPDSRVLNLAFDPDDNLWVTFNGFTQDVDVPLSVYDGDAWVNINTVQDTLALIDVDELIIRADGTKFIGANTFANGVYYNGILTINENDTTYYTHTNSDINLACRHSSFIDNNNNVWFGGCYNKLCRFDGNQWHDEAPDFETDDYSYYAISQDKNGNMLLGTTQGLYIENGDDFQFFTDTNGLASPYVYDIALNNVGEIWLATLSLISNSYSTDVALTKYDNGDFMHYFPNTHVGNVKAVVSHESEIYALGDVMAGAFLSVLENGLWQFDEEIDDSFDEAVSSIAIDGSGNMWYATEFGLFVDYGDGVPIEIESILDETLNYVGDIASYGESIWLVSNNKLFQFYNDNWSIIENSVYANAKIHPLNESHIWLSENSGARFYDGSIWEIYNEENGLGESFWVNDIAFNNDSVWFATRYGVVLFYNDDFSFYLNDSSFQSGYSNFNAIHTDEVGNLLLGNKNGLVKYDFETIEYIQPAGYADEVYSISTDEFNNVWVCSKTCISKQIANENSISEIILGNNLPLYPNPTNSGFYIDVTMEQQGDIVQIYTISGKLLMQKTMNYGRNYISVNDLPSGIYIVKLKIEGSIAKLMVE